MDSRLEWTSGVWATMGSCRLVGDDVWAGEKVPAWGELWACAEGCGAGEEEAE